MEMPSLKLNVCKLKLKVNLYYKCTMYITSLSLANPMVLPLYNVVSDSVSATFFHTKKLLEEYNQYFKYDFWLPGASSFYATSSAKI